MIETKYDFEQAILPTGTPLQTNLLLRFRADLPESPRRDLNLSLVIDRSGSMAGAPLHHALKAAESVVDQLEATDTLSVVVYDDVVDVPVAPQAVSDKSALKSAIRRVQAGGLTNLSGGWLKGCEFVKAHLDPQKVNRVLLLTDGHANMGIQDPRVLTTTSGQKAEEGIATTTLGFAQGFNEDMLIGMARASKGNFYFIQSIDEASEVFSIELDSLRAVVGQNLSVTIELAPGVELLDTLSLAEVTQTAQGSTVIGLGDLYEREDKLLGLSLSLPSASVGDLPIMRVHYSADVIQDGAIQSVAGTSEIVAKIGTIEESASAASSHILLELSQLTIAKTKETALNLAEQGKHQEAEFALRSLIQNLRSKGLDETFEIAEEIEQLDYFANRIAQGALGNAGRKELRDQSFQSLTRNRSDLAGRGVTAGEEIAAMATVQEVGSGIELICVREGGKLRVKVVSDGYDSTKNVQFPRAIRAEGARYVVEGIELSADQSFYRVQGQIQRFVKPGEVDVFASFGRSRSRTASTASKAPATAAALPTTDTVGDGILVQCVKDGSKLRARVVADGYEPDWNMRFPRSIREEGMLYVVEAVKTAPDGKSYIACGEIKRFVQAAIAS
ncbi:von Willebrand factor type A [Leptolyngbya boryana NIES-2135]|jgi:Ca-activated chloride channel family protein|uniref:von Willebrand factor type A n=1 Tax=Leptolyngbya boryana NIES-2135 TaxID=1973484 RepID=A0A1Z4JEQ0_LEPBY|nr:MULTISPECIES: VWA domain-containing protein [Leptolyngbya]BAY55133.1 von Willebrand factor type A [Leptolyngbya boryana NIES-2135]MBD2366113.1 VWA domain-containing protein [Leptolyngbya sp. FACHB-161]MBD2372293.1 VWA domain-containing protein [Leptolyngbya sp. FACHB-238]MBD2396716.1 VWA domain-containing protein [Leptolyngbya sp. FACHB-239]MBD2403239.1 VWA domain-containing protein [Leptolyngbya sp. FACHB-402]